MKKYLSKALAATSTALLLVCLSACGGANEADTSRIAALEQSLSALESEKNEIAKERDRYNGLHQDLERQLSALSETESELSKCREDLARVTDLNEKSTTRIKELEDRIESLESRKKDLTSQLADTQKKLSDAITELASPERKPAERVSREYVDPDGTYTKLTSVTKYRQNELPCKSYLLLDTPDVKSKKILECNEIYSYSLSPDATRVIADNFSLEGGSTTVYMYDIRTDSLSELALPDLPIAYAPSYLEWLDERYFLFVLQLDHGTVSRGGDVYVYDTETGEYRRIVANPEKRFQISEIHTYGNDFVVFESVMYDETMNFTVPKHNVLTCDEIMQLIRGKSEIDLSAMTAPEK